MQSSQPKLKTIEPGESLNHFVQTQKETFCCDFALLSFFEDKWKKQAGAELCQAQIKLG